MPIMKVLHFRLNVAALINALTLGTDGAQTYIICIMILLVALCTSYWFNLILGVKMQQVHVSHITVCKYCVCVI